MKLSFETKMEKSDEKLDSMTVLMLHYCAGLQHCLDQEEEERVKQLEEKKQLGEDRDETSSRVLDEDSVRSGASVEATGGHNGSTMCAESGGQVEMEEDILMINVMEPELSSEVDEDATEDVTFVSDNEVMLSICETTVPPCSAKNTRTYTPGDTEPAETDTSNVVTCSAEQNVDVEESSEVTKLEISAETCYSRESTHEDML